MTGHTIHELDQIAAAMARNALRIDAKHTQEERAQATYDQQALMADLDRAELEFVTRALAAILAEVTKGFAKARSNNAERLLERFINRFAADAAKDPPDDRWRS